METIIEYYDDRDQISTVEQLVKIIESTAKAWQREVISISHDRPSNRVYIQAVVIYK